MLSCPWDLQLDKKPASHHSLTLVLQSAQVHLKDFVFQLQLCATGVSFP